MTMVIMATRQILDDAKFMCLIKESSATHHSANSEQHPATQRSLLAMLEMVSSGCAVTGLLGPHKLDDAWLPLLALPLPATQPCGVPTRICTHMSSCLYSFPTS